MVWKENIYFNSDLFEELQALRSKLDMWMEQMETWEST